MQLVHKENHIARPAHVTQHRFDPVFKIAPVLGARQHRGDVQRHNALAAEVRRRLTARHRQGKSLCHGGLAHARLPDEHGVVFAAPGQDLDGAADLSGSAHHGINEPVGCLLRQVQAVLVEDARLGSAQRRAQSTGLGAAPGIRVAEYVHDRGADIVEIYSCTLECPHSAAVGKPKKPQQQMLRADAAVAQSLSLSCRLLQCSPGVRRQPQSRRAGTAHAGFPRNHTAQVLALQPLTAENVRAQTVLFLHDAEQQVLGADIGVAQLTGSRARGFNGNLRPLGKFFVALHRASLPFVTGPLSPAPVAERGETGKQRKYRQNQTKI